MRGAAPEPDPEIAMNDLAVGQTRRFKKPGMQKAYGGDLVVAEVHNDAPVVEWTNEPTARVRYSKGRHERAWTQKSLLEHTEAVDAGY